MSPRVAPAAGMETVVANLVEPGETIVVGVNGIWCETIVVGVNHSSRPAWWGSTIVVGLRGGGQP